MPSIRSVVHPALGRLVRVEGVAEQPLRLTPTEAATIARALLAVGEGRSTETEIYLSPIASDDAFQATVVDGGVVIAGRRLSWPEAAALAQALAAAAEPEA